MSPKRPGSPQARALAHVAAHASGGPIDPTLRVNLNFHPDRLLGGVPILQALAQDGVYRSQFETGSSNGGLTAHPGGDRWSWESRIFGTAYDDVDPVERPKYGALNIRRYRVGAARRFGSAHLRLNGEVLGRSSFCYPDSAAEPAGFGVADQMSLVDRALTDGRDLLDDYIEAQVHGPVRLDQDVEAIVLDPSFRGTTIESDAERLPFTVEWHRGFRLTVETLRDHADYRGAETVQLGESLAVDGVIDAVIIGAAARSGDHELQALKLLWHCLARFGLHEA